MNLKACLSRQAVHYGSPAGNWYTLDVVLNDDFPHA